MRRFILPVATAILLGGCEAPGMLAPEPIGPEALMLMTQNPDGVRCHGVQFDMVFRGILADPFSPPHFEGELVPGGDLEGTVEIILTGATDPTGRTNTATFGFTWHITGGVIPELHGESFVTEVANRNLNQVPPPTPFGMAVGHHREVGGVARAHLTYIGHAEAVDPGENFFVFETPLQHRGVICP